MNYLSFGSFIVIFHSFMSCSCWQYFTSLAEVRLDASGYDELRFHSEYFFGECKRDDIRLFTSIDLSHMDILGKVIVRGWIDIIRIPVCIRLRAYSHAEDLIRSTAFQFQMCVPRISYCHSQARVKYFYYEWYIPPDMIGGMDWKLMFFGIKSLQWG